MQLILLGPRASGKSTLGRAVAARADRPFVDLDELVLARFAEPTVAEVWSVHGEHAWRDAERDVLLDALDGRLAGVGPDAILALGGGTPMIDAARDRLQLARASRQARIVHLVVPSVELVRRLRAAPGDRPALTPRSEDPAAEVDATLAAREGTYRALADVTVDGTRPLEELVSTLLDAPSGS